MLAQECIGLACGTAQLHQVQLLTGALSHRPPGHLDIMLAQATEVMRPRTQCPCSICC